MPEKRNKLAVYGESTIFGFGVGDQSFGARTARLQGLEFVNHAGYGATVIDSLGLLDDAASYETVIAMHGTNEAMVRPTDRALAFMPPRWRRRGWMDPRAYYPTSWRRALPKRIESAIRWRVKVALIRMTGGSNVMARGDFETAMREFVEQLKSLGVPNVILVGPPAVDERFFPYSPAKMADYGSIVAKIAAEHGAIYVSAAEHLRQWDDYYPDHLHASAGGHERIAAQIERELMLSGSIAGLGEHRGGIAGDAPIAQQRQGTPQDLGGLQRGARAGSP